MDELQKLYDVLIREGKYTKSFEEFQTKWSQDQSYKDKVYDVVLRDGLYTKDKDSFFQKYGAPVVKKKGTQGSLQLLEDQIPSTDLPLGIGSLEFAKPTKPAQEGPTEKLAVGSMGITGLERTKEYKPEDGQGFLLNIVSSLDKGFYNLPGEAVKGVGTLLEGVTGKGFVSDALNKFGSSYLKAIEELTPQDESFKGSLSDQFGQAFGQVASMVLTSGASQAVKTTTALSAAKAAIASQAAPKAVTIGGAVKKLASELLDPAAVSMGLAMGQGEFERAKQAGATDEQAFEAFYKNAAVGSVLERIPVMQFLKRFNKASAGGVVNYLKTKAIGGLTGGTEEMITEVLQQLYANQTAQDIYNINQDLFEGVGESGGIGFGVGFLLNAMGANAKLLRKQGKNDEADVIENQMTQFKNAPKPPADPPPTYSVSGIKITDPIVINDIIDNMEGTDLAKSNIEITNDPELNDRLQNKIVTSSIKEQVRQGNPELNEPSLNAITELEKELKKLEGNKTQTGKDKAAAIRTQIKDIQENQLQEEAVTETIKTEQDAIQKQTAGQVPVLTEAGVSQEVPGGLTQAEPQGVAQEGVQEEGGSGVGDNLALKDVESTAKALKKLDDEGDLNKIFTKKEISIADIAEESADGQKLSDAIVNVKDGLKSKTEGKILVYESGGKYYIADGFHRVAEAILNGDKSIQADIVYAKPKDISEAYHKAKLDGSNPELVKAVEALLPLQVPQVSEVSLKTQPNVNLRITELEKEKSKLTSKALKQFPQSPAQMKTRARIDEINAELKTLKAEPEAVSSKTQEVAPVVEQYVPIVPKQITNEKFTRDNSIDYEEGERETDSGRTVTYLASLTVEAQDENGDTVGSLTKITDEDGIVSWNAADVDGNELSFDGFDSKDEAKQALVDKVNKERKKEFDKEAKKKVKAKEKKKFDEIYNKYDKLINPLLKSAKQLGEDIALVEASSGVVDIPALANVESEKQQIENFGVAPDMVESVYSVIGKVFEGLKKAGLTAAKNVGEWVGIGKGEEKPYSLKISGKDVQVKNISPDVVNGFYSPLEKIITDSKFDKLPAKQWIEKYANSEEAKWTGLKDWLAQQEGSVSKADIQQYLKDNRIEVVEVVKGSEGSFDDGFYVEDNGDSVFISARNSDMGDEPAYTITEEDGSWYITDNFEGEDFPEANSKEEALYDIKRRYNDSKNKAEVNTKFSQYQLEGQKEGYKEILVTLPIMKYEVMPQGNGFVVYDFNGREISWGVTRDGALKKAHISDSQIGKFKSSHFDEPNILVHLRMNTRTDSEGNKVLFLEEVQSDWGQKGKKEGFKDEAKQKQWDDLEKKRQELWNEVNEKHKGQIVPPLLQQKINEVVKKQQGLYEGLQTPTAPFVTDTNAWTKLGLKVALKEAVKQGADKIAWTTGEQQNARYDLSKQVDSITSLKKADGTYEIIAKKEGQDVVNEGGVDIKRIEAIFGKDIAQKISENKGQYLEIKGDNLKTQGKGMKGFYGSPSENSLGIVGNVAKSLFKQEPKTVEIETTKNKPTDFADFNEYSKNTFNEYSKNTVKVENTEDVKKYSKSGYKFLDASNKVIDKNQAYELIERGQKIRAVSSAKSTQHSIDITPELKASVEGGQPLFKDAEAQYRIESGKNIVEAIKDFNGSPRATVALTHEIMHPTVVAIIDGAKEGNEVGAKHTQTIVDEFNKATGQKVTVEDLIKGNDAFKDGTTSKQYRAVQEFIAKSWEKYHREGGKGFSEVFQKVLQQITEAFQSVYKSLTEKQLTPELRKMFDEILGKSESLLSKEQSLPTQEVKAKVVDNLGNQNNNVNLQNGTDKVQSERTGDRTGRTQSRTITPLEGTPSVPGVNGPDPQLVAVADQYAQDNGIPFKRQAEYVTVDEGRAIRISEAYEAMADDPQNPKVKEAYQNLIKQTMTQYKALVDAGYKFWFMDLNIPSNAEYASTPFNAIRDLRVNKEMGVFPTTDGYGDGGLTELNVEKNPLLADTGIQWPVGGLDGEMKTVLANDLFRAVHDAFGHGLEGSGFRARGEENAWQAHVRLFTGSAIAAMTSETRGQNSWLNYGPNGEQNRTASVDDTVFAEQKIGLMPKWTWTEGKAADMEERQFAEEEVEPTAEEISEIDALLDLDMDDEDNMLSVLNALDRVDTAITKRLRGGANEALLAIPLSTIQVVIKAVKALVKGGMILRDAIRKVATDNNISQDTIKDIINIAPIQDGFNELMGKVDDLIASQKSKGIEDGKITSNIDTFIREQDEYLNANDAQKKIIEREARAKMGAAPKRAVSIGRVLGALKDITNISRKEKLKIISQIRQLSKDAAKDLVKEIREMASSGKITPVQAANIIAKTLNINPLNEASVSNFVDYMVKVFANAEYVGKMTTALAQIKNAKTNIKTKIGVAQDLFEPLNQLLSINPTLIPLNQLEKYLGILKDFSARKAVLSIDDRVKVLKQVNEILDEINNELSTVDVLADRFNNYDKQVFNEEGGIDYAATIKKMIDNGLISTDEADLMKKYKSEILPQVEATPLTEEEIAEQKKEQIKILKSLNIDNKEFPLPNRNEKEDAIYLAKLIKELSVEDLMNISLTDLKNIIKVIDNINNGYLPNYAKISIEKLNAIKEGKVLSNAIEKGNPLSFSKLYSRLKNKFTEKGVIDELIRANPLYYIDNVFGDFKTRDIFNSLFEKSAQALSIFNSELKRIEQKIETAQNKVLASFNQNSENYLMSKFRMTAYMLQREYESNIGKKGVKYTVSQYLEETIKHIATNKSIFKEADAKKLQKILKEVESYIVDGKIDLDKFYKIFNSAEKNAINVMTEINKSLGETAAYTAAVIRGDKVELMDNYFHHNVLHEQNPMDATSAPEFSSSYSNSMRPSTKAKSLIERTDKLTPLNFDLFTSTYKGAKFVLLDYNLTSPIRTAKRTLIQAKKNLQKVADKKARDEAKKTGVTDENKLSKITGVIPKQQTDINNAIENAYEEALQNILTNTIVQDGLSNATIDFIQKQGYRATLAGTTRFQAELLSNIANALLINPLGFTEGIKHAKLIASANGYQFMKNAKAKQLFRLYASDALSGKMVDPQILKQTSGIKGSVSKGALRNRTLQIYNLTLKKYLQNPVEYIADIMLTTPDKVVSMPLWFGSFMNEFKKITGEEVNQDMMINNDLDYMEKYADAIEQATRKADQESVYSGASNNEFMGILKGKIKPNQGFSEKAWNNFNSYMTNFMNFDYAAARSAVYNLFNEGYMTKKKAAAVLAGITTRSVIYQVMVANMGAGIVGGALGLAFDWEDEEEVDEKSFFQKLGRGLANVFVGYTVGRNFGNAVRGMINYGVEQINEEYLDFLRNGEYDFYKDNIAYSYLNFNERGDIDIPKVAVNMAGVYTPALNTAILIGANFNAIKSKLKGEGSTKKEPEAIRREDMTVNYRIPLEVAGNLGLIPIYKDVKRAVNDEIYKDLRKAANTSSSSIISTEDYEKFKALRELKDKTNDEDELREINKRIIKLRATPVQKEKYKEANKREAAKKKRLLYDSETGKRYDNETKLKRYNPRLYNENFGPQSDWYQDHKAENDINKALNKKVREIEDKEFEYTPKNKSNRNSDGTLKRKN